MKKFFALILTIFLSISMSFADWNTDLRSLVSENEKKLISQKISSKFSQLEKEKGREYLVFEVNYIISKIDRVLSNYTWKALSEETQKNIGRILLVQDSLKKIVGTSNTENITKQTSQEYSKSQNSSKPITTQKSQNGKKDLDYLKSKVYKYVQPDKDGQFVENGKSYIITSYSCSVLPNKTDLSYFDDGKLSKYLLVLDVSKGKSQYLLCQKFEIKPSSIGISLNDIRSQMLKQLNDIRAQNGLNPLKLNDNLNKAAQLHAEDMNKNNYFSHNSLTGKRPSERCKNAGYDSCGENIAVGAANVEEVMEGWMNSKGHRENILTPDYKEIGIGFDNYYWVQDFGFGD